MAMLFKWATGSHLKDNTKDDSEGNAVIQASGDFKYELPRPGDPSEAANVVGAASSPYTLEKAKQYTDAAEKNLGGASKVDGSTVVAAKKLGWYNIVRMLKWRKICKYRNLVGVEPTAPTAVLYDAAP
jgi:hypothetical protein